MLHHAAISVIYTLFKEVHSLNAFIIEFTLAGIEMEVNALQSSYLQPVITQYFASNKSEIWS